MALDSQSLKTYLDRIDYHGPVEPNLGTLTALHRAHMLAVPFENLDIPRGRTIVVDEAKFYEKVIARRRGGFCYELNGVFHALLRELGFDVALLSAGVARADGDFGPEYDHLTLLVQLDEPWIADVGFGDSFREPLALNSAEPQFQDRFYYQIAREDPFWKMKCGESPDSLTDQYRFTLTPRRLEDFAEMCRYHQTSPQSTFTQKQVCSRATPRGRVSLSGLRLIITEDGERSERELTGQAEYEKTLLDLFGVTLDS